MDYNLELLNRRIEIIEQFMKEEFNLFYYQEDEQYVCWVENIMYLHLNSLKIRRQAYLMAS